MGVSLTLGVYSNSYGTRYSLRGRASQLPGEDTLENRNIILDPEVPEPVRVSGETNYIEKADRQVAAARRLRRATAVVVLRRQ